MDGGQHFLRPPFLRRDAIKPSLQFQHLARREEGVEIDLLRHDPDRYLGVPRIAVDVETPDLRRAPGLADETRQDIDAGGLARTIGTEKAEDGTARYREIDPLERMLVGLALFPLVDLLKAAHLDRILRIRGQGIRRGGRR